MVGIEKQKEQERKMKMIGIERWKGFGQKFGKDLDKRIEIIRIERQKGLGQKDGNHLDRKVERTGKKEGLMGESNERLGE